MAVFFPAKNAIIVLQMVAQMELSLPDTAVEGQCVAGQDPILVHFGVKQPGSDTLGTGRRRRSTTIISSSRNGAAQYRTECVNLRDPNHQVAVAVTDEQVETHGQLSIVGFTDVHTKD